MKNADAYLMRRDILTNPLPFTIEYHTVSAHGRALQDIHYHDYFELELICGGSGFHIRNEITSPLKPGSIYLLTPSDCHTVTADTPAGIRLLNINFQETMLPEGLINAIYEQTEPLSASLQEADFAVLLQEAERLRSEYAEFRPYREIAIQSLLTHLCLSVLRASAAQRPRYTGGQAAGAALREVLVYIKRNFRTPISKTETAARFHYSANYFGDLFRRETGLSYTDYVKKLRLQYAANLLRGTSLSVSEISERAGFRSPAYFTKAFRIYYKKTPRAYRAEHREGMPA